MTKSGTTALPGARASGTTRDRLIVAAAHLFARHGIEEVPLRDVAHLAGQRNASAVQYHFDGRWDLVAAILVRHGDTVQGWAAPLAEQSVDAIVISLVELLRPKLTDAEGRDFLRVIFELMSRYPGRWDEAARDLGRAPGRAGFRRVVDRLTSLLTEQRRDGLPRDLPRDVARARAISMTQFVTYQFAERSRLIDEGERRGLSDARFAANLEAMALALLTAPLPAATPDLRTSHP
jgi:AcrR family transcriptional regulator